MRLKLSLNLVSRSIYLPFNYQYFLSSWIYRTIQSSNSGFSAWLHEQGYGSYGKRFKLFTFSQLQLQKPWRPAGDRIKLSSRRATLIVSFAVDQAVEHFLIGLFQQQRLPIDPGAAQAALFEVETVERLPDPDFKGEVSFRCLSPICLSRDREEGRPPEYLSPTASGYGDMLYQNLLFKYLAASGQEITVDRLRSQMEARQHFSFRLLNEPRSKLQTIKPGKPQETRVKGYRFRFKITAAPELLAFAYQTGFGEKNSLGFGCVEEMG